MDDSIESGSDPRRPVDRYLGNYSEDHRHPANKLIHWICVPIIVWAVLALIWVIPVPAGLGRPGLWAGLAMVAAISFYLRLSRPLAFAMLASFVALAALTHLLHDALGPRGLLITAITIFVLAWIAQFVGHHIEGKRPSFFTDLAYLLIGPLWLMAHLFRRMGWAY
jgi:uncharacterized membrane protein YGL010W